MRARFAILTLTAAAALGGCAYGYDPYGGGYGGLSVGYGNYSSYGYGGGYRDYGYYNPYYYGGFGRPYYGSYGGYGSPYYGWYGSNYYPGSGIYVYDSYRRPRVWSSTERSYWTSRQPRTRVSTSGTVRTETVKQNWSGFNQRATARTQRQEQRATARTQRQEQHRRDRSQ